MAGFFASIRNRGLQLTLELVSIKIRSILELFIPHTIWGEHVGLRSVKGLIRDEDIKQIYAWSQDEDVLRWTGGAPFGLTLEEFRDQIRAERWRPQWNQRLFYIVTKTDGIVGRVGLFTIDWVKREGEFGISLDKRYWDKRLGREATNLLIQYIFSRTPIRRIYLGTFQENLRAQRSFTASGFHVTGTMRRLFPGEERYVDGVAMEVTLQDAARLGLLSVNKENKQVG